MRSVMKQKLFMCVLVSMFGTQILLAQQSPSIANDFVPASTNIRGAEYPQVNSEGRVKFRINAPQANSISVLGTTLVKGDDGYFTGITEPMTPGFISYTINIDGVEVADPASESFFDVGFMRSGLEIPEKGVDFYDFKNVPHGEVRSHWYVAGSNNQMRQAFIYTPPGYDDDIDKRYPVLYLQHGMNQDRRAWSTQGRMSFILDNLIAEGKAVPMIIVTEDGGITGINRSSGREGGNARGRGFGSMGSEFIEAIISDVIPMVDATYRTIPDRDHRAMAGLSLGGYQTYQITQANLDKFAYIGVFSAPGGFTNIEEGYNGLLAKPEEFDKLVKVIFISMGSKEGARTGRQPAEQMKAAGIKNVVYYEAPGTAHEFQTWRKSLHQFAPLLFKD